MKTPSRTYHADIPFELWTSRGAWFWRLVVSGLEGGIMGIASSQAEAMHEARAAIDELASNLHVRLARDRVSPPSMSRAVLKPQSNACPSIRAAYVPR
jgi:hypothetical protein